MVSSTSSFDGTAAAPDLLGPDPSQRSKSAVSTADSESSFGTGLQRPVPDHPWPKIMVAVLVTTFALMLGWEMAMRNLGLAAGDLDDDRDYWVEERRRLDRSPADAVVIIGDSRILFGTELAKWKELTGRRPVQLALPATSSLPFLHDLADDERFKGLVVIGISEPSLFTDDYGRRVSVLKYLKDQSPSQRSGHYLYKEASRHLAFLDSNYKAFDLLKRLDWPVRPGVEPLEVWKISEAYDDRQLYLWNRVATDPKLNAHARYVWQQYWEGDPASQELIDSTIAKAKVDIDRIRARGGEVVWLRAPSAGPLLAAEHQRFPRATGWDRIVRETGSFGVNFEDYAQMRNLDIPEWSHLSQAGAQAYTDAYVRVLLDRVEWLKTRSKGWREEGKRRPGDG
ncbi:hypothetical protein J5226_03880 [Lysobacter sp. K5869]|uniref:hypothetical protein n=1 Tax=Lysobacter sp. K5869 TaxID=2820808 RepID=UPI001C060458|nr:hypothetical protein [Lysobacter sp. K5869]QWP77557.1 hypothetical protein J5226_03880 [Lysobacter sp. K5869]